jgi:uncharacterized protein YcfJ
MRAIEEKQMKIRNVLLVGVLGLSLSGCLSTNGTMAGGLAGAAAGGYAGSMVGSGLGNTIATVGGALGGAVVGGFLGNSLTKPYENSDRIDQTMTAVDRNGRRIDHMDGRLTGMANNTGGGSNVYMMPNGGGNQNQNPYNCKIIQNYVVCNSQ